ncbi:DNA repair protein RecN [Virgibacillus soli]|uniref:DNA repair protein RecN n=1 Tax=Paracerasibacillus soli TaxID=480284 RepID=UPI0035EB98E8
MLTELSIRDFAIIDKISVTFMEGLTVLTGETGAGKSIIIDAIQLLAGGRGSVEFVRHNSKKAEITGLFTIDNKKHAVYKIGEQYGVEIMDGQLVLERTITAQGKSICRVNGRLVTLAILREFGTTLIDIHSQHETQSLMNRDNHIELLDYYDKEAILKAKHEYLKIYEKLQTLKKRYQTLNENEKEMAHRIDLLSFQYKELEEAKLQIGEDESLEKERSSLVHYEQLFQAVQAAYDALYGEQKGLDWINIAQQALQDGRDYDSSIQEKSDRLTNMYYNIEELSYELRHFRDQLEYNPTRLNEIESRLAEIDRLKKKYGNSVSEMLEYMVKIEEEMEQITNKDSHLAKLADQILELEEDAYLEAKQLHDLRKNAAKLLEEEVHQELIDLYLEKASFQIAFNHDFKNVSSFKALPLHKNGVDQIHFLISTNPGEPLKELEKVASGGELSRIMLALKKIFAKHQGVTSVIFDEVDTGVSGRVAQAIANKIYHISNDSQVLCITHLPQVAAMADSHKFIEKEEKDQRHVTNIRDLSMAEQVDELSRMVTGTIITETAKDHAKELLLMAQNQKKKLVIK